MPDDNKIKIAFIKYAGLASGGTEKFLQNIAIKLPKDKFEVDYYYCDSSPYVGSDFKHIGTDTRNIEPMLKAGVKLIEFKVGAKDITKRTHDWVDTNFWEVFQQNKYNIIQTGRAGAPEYPFTKIKNTPIVDSIHFLGGVDNQYNISKVMHITKWSADRWVRFGGDKNRVVLVSHPMIVNGSIGKSLRDELGLQNKTIFGFHQRDSDEIYSDIPLIAFREIEDETNHFIIMGGSKLYREQAKNLGIKNITFLDFSGDREKIYSFLKSLDIYAHGRKDGEVNSTAMAEALYFGLPVISHKSEIHNGHVECIGDAGIVVDSTDDYVKALNLYSDPKYRKEKRDLAKKRFQDLYEENGQMRNIVNIYMDVVNNPYPNKIKRFISSFRIKFIYKKILEKTYYLFKKK